MRSFLLALILAAPAVGQVSGPSEVTVPVGRLAPLPLTVEGGQFDYLILGDALDGFREYDPDPKRLRLRIIGYSPGTAWVVVSSFNAGKLQPPFVVKVTVTGAPIPPPPPPDPVPPGPGPGPGPAPVPTGAAWVVLVTDQANDSPAVAALIASPRLRKSMSDWGLRFRVYDKESPSVRDKGLAAHAAGKVPALIVLDKDGRVLLAQLCPADDAATIEAIRKAAGK